VEQIIGLAQKKKFNYMLIEASGVSEPSQISPLFNLCDEEHDHGEHKDVPQLGEIARLDTCVTVVDAAEFYNNLESMKVYEEGGEVQGTIAELMMEQVEYSNVVVLNKGDLVSEAQQGEIIDRISILNPRAKVLKSCYSKINVMEILNTHLYSREEFEEGSVMISAMKAEAGEKIEAEATKSCCKKSLAEGGTRCCKRKAKNGQLVDSGLSKVLLGVVQKNTVPKITRHTARFGITSFVYRARRPFHPGRLLDRFLEPFFIDIQEAEDLDKLQKQAAYKQANRVKFMGELLRSKGFIWIATSNSVMGGFQQAGNVLRIVAEGPWMCEIREIWEGTPSGVQVLKDMIKENGEEWPYADRRQELVFIGHKLNHTAIQKTLDQCLLNDEEMNMGPEKWEEYMASSDNIQLSLDDSEYEIDEDEETHERDEN